MRKSYIIKHKMYKGGSTYSSLSTQIIRYSGLFVPIILMAYGVLIQFDFIHIPHVIDNVGFFVFLFWWLFVSVLQFISPIKTRLDSVLRLIAYHLLAGSYLIFISGIESPFVACWLLLMSISYIYFSIRGLQLSILTFILVVLFDISLWHRISTMITIYDLIALLVILLTGVFALYISQSQRNTKDELDRSRAQESLHRDRISTIVNNLTDAVLSTDSDGIIRVYNAASLNLLDTNISLNGHHIDEMLPLIGKQNNNINIFKEFQQAKTVVKRDDLYYSIGDDEKIRLEITYAPIRGSYGRSRKSQLHDGYIIIMRDITKAKSLEEERDEFISVTSHELRTPITIAEGTISNAQIMIDHPDVSKKMLKSAINTAHEQIMFLAHMVNDLSTLSSAERNVVVDDTDDINVRELAHKLHHKYAGEAKAKKLHLDLDLSPTLSPVHASRLYLEELLQNLLTNAIKYTKKGSITIVIEQKDDMISFAVRDTGIGISKSDQSKIFTKFYRSEDYRTRETSGTGLGLYISTKLAHKLGTEVTFTSRLNFGSTFGFALPAKNLSATPPTDPKSHHSN